MKFVYHRQTMPRQTGKFQQQQPAGRPRKPERANGRRRYEMLLDAAERLLVREGPDALTIQRLAKEAHVPMASVYHFFPSPAAVSVGLSERYLAGFGELVGRPIENVTRMTWQDIVATLIDRGVAYYSDHPYAQRLILGSDHSWQIRSADLANNRLLAASIAELLADQFPHVNREELLQAVIVGISIGDAIFTLSIFDQGTITPDFGREATVAICGYLSTKFGQAPDSGH
ncbi:MAG: TetR/AcrR family transcriptional regulator [Alphaproteobacteria bacterium]|nr:TetR/AcrR family transcriptional regulator [Alphaproteobacteria bacterium]